MPVWMDFIIRMPGSITIFSMEKTKKELKGAPETFDAEAMYALIKETKAIPGGRYMTVICMSR